jgi:hypothetical protein
MSHRYEIRTFLPKESDPLFNGIAEQLYSASLRLIHRPLDAINKEYAAAGICVLKDDKPAGRLIAYAATGVEAHSKKSLVLGNYECIDDDHAAQELLNAAADLARMEGYKCLVGPMSGTTWDTYRFCTNPEAGMFLSEPVHQPWYVKQWTENGFETLADYVSTIDRNLTCNEEDALQQEKHFTSAGVHFRNIDLDHYEDELKKLFPLCEKAFSNNFLYTPVKWETFRDKYIAVKAFVVPEMIFLAETAAGELAGFAFNIHDHFCQDEKRMVVKTVARDPDPRFRGLGNVLSNMSQRYARDHAYSASIHALMYSGNYSVKLSEKYTGAPFKHYKLFMKLL